MDTQVKVGLAEMLRGGVILDVVDAAQARIAEEAGAAAVMALERVRFTSSEKRDSKRLVRPKMNFADDRSAQWKWRKVPWMLSTALVNVVCGSSARKSTC